MEIFTNMHSLFGTARESNPGPFDAKSDTLTTSSPSSSFICSEAQIQYSAKTKTWTLNKMYQAHDSSYGGL